MSTGNRAKEIHDVVYVIPRLEGSSSLLVTRRSSTEQYYKDKLNCVIEHLENGERPLQAAVRGVREELGIEVEPARMREIGEGHTEDDENMLSINIMGIFEIKVSKDEYDKAVESEGEAQKGSKMQIDSSMLKELVRSGSFTHVDAFVLNTLGLTWS